MEFLNNTHRSPRNLGLQSRQLRFDRDSDSFRKSSARKRQRLLTEEAARAAGFEVLGLSNEPSASAIEVAYRNREDRKNRAKSGFLVSDLGGGTFDVSLLAIGDAQHSVVASDGIPDFGGTISTRSWRSWRWRQRAFLPRSRTRSCDSSGNLKVRIGETPSGYAKEFRLGHGSKNGKRNGRR